MPKSEDMSTARGNKKDEFYTQLSDIELEMKNYKDYFKGKTVFCNCDDPFESNFFKYFAMKFNSLGLKKLITTCYDQSPLMGQQLSLFDIEGIKDDITEGRHAYKVEITEVNDENGDGAIDYSDIEYLLKNNNQVLSLLEGNGDFRSQECIDILKEADVVVTNPPFSLFREFITQLFEYKKDFIILGNVNAIKYKEVFPFIKDNQVWLGASIHSGDREFRVPSDYPLNASNCRIDDKGNKYIRVKGVRWFTNLEYPKRCEDLILYKRYTPEEYPKYDNYPAINVCKTTDIPCDYADYMAVPITFLDKYNPKQFEIVDLLNTYTVLDVLKTNDIVRANKTHTCNVNGKPTFSRIVVKNKNPKDAI